LRWQIRCRVSWRASGRPTEAAAIDVTEGCRRWDCWGHRTGYSCAAKLPAAAATAMRTRASFTPRRRASRAVCVIFSTAQCSEFLAVRKSVQGRDSTAAGLSDLGAQRPHHRLRRYAPPVCVRNQPEMHSLSRSDAHLSTGRLRAGPGDSSSK
jgi:hypothetical protein